MTGNKTLSTTLAAAIFLAIPLSIGTAQAEAIKPAKQEIVLLDRTTTGSVDQAGLIRNCDPHGPNANMICKITGGDPDVKFPSAPISNFGF